MNKKEKELQKKLMTKKELKNLNKQSRSEFATLKMGVRYFKNGKTYNRKKDKARLKKEMLFY